MARRYDDGARTRVWGDVRDAGEDPGQLPGEPGARFVEEPSQPPVRGRSSLVARTLPLVGFLLLSCCHAKVGSRLLPREDGTVSVVSVAREEWPAAAKNVSEANRYCEKQNRRAVFFDEQTEYRGVLTQRGSSLARIVKNIPTVGSRLTSDEDYRVTTSFKCIATG